MSSKLPPDNFPVATLRNLGPRSAMMLAEVGIRTIGELRAIGAVKAYIRVRENHTRGASVNLLWSMATGLKGLSWRDISAEEKASLLAEVNRLRRPLADAVKRQNPVKFAAEDEHDRRQIKKK
jgi:DNA transformation protein and related proteins